MPQILLFERSGEVNVCCGRGPCATPVPETETTWGLPVSVPVGESPIAMSVMLALRSMGIPVPTSIESLTGFAYASMRSKVEVGLELELVGSEADPVAANVFVLSKLEIGSCSGRVVGWAGSVGCVVAGGWAGSFGCWGEGDCGGSCGWGAFALVRHCDCSTVPAGAMVGGFKLVKHSAVFFWS